MAERKPAAGGASTAATALIFAWAGGAITGNMIAAPAKFQAPSLTLPVALDVGRAQFFWIGMAESACACALLLLLIAARRLRSWPLAAALALFALQQVWIMPLLDARTLAVIAGQPVPVSSLHLMYVVCEILKISCLILAGALFARAPAERGQIQFPLQTEGQ
jgi:hypothetical protein